MVRSCRRPESKEFSGAEIEGAFKDGVLEGFIDGDRSAETKDILKAVESITPTAQKMMSEKIEDTRNWLDGPYVEALAEGAGAWTGSGNQRVIDLCETRRTGRIALY